MNKKIVLLLVLILIVSIFTGCQSKAPEGINEDIWQDCLKMIKILNVAYEEGRLLKTKEEIEIYNKFVDFYDGNNNLNEDEKELVDAILGFKFNWETYLKYSKNDKIPQEDANKHYDKAMEYYENIETIIK